VLLKEKKQLKKGLTRLGKGSRHLGQKDAEPSHWHFSQQSRPPKGGDRKQKPKRKIKRRSTKGDPPYLREWETCFTKHSEILGGGASEAGRVSSTVGVWLLRHD